MTIRSRNPHSGGAVEAGVSPDTGRTSLETSAAFRLYAGLARYTNFLLCGFFVWFDEAFRSSLVGQAFYRVSTWGSRVFKDSIVFRSLYPLALLAVAPWREGIAPETALGLALAAANVLPTEPVFLLTVASFGILIWSRSKEAAKRKLQTGAVEVLTVPRFQIGLPLIVIFMFLVGSTVSSVAPRASVQNLVIWCFYGLFLLLGVDAGYRGKADKVLWPVITGSTLSGMVGIYQHMTGWQPPRSWLDEKFEEEIVRVVGTFGNPTFLAEMLGLTLPIVLALILKRKSIMDRLFLAACALLQGYALVLTWSRGAWLGFMVSFALLAVLYERRLLMLGLVLAVAAVALAPPVIVERLVSSFSSTDSSNAYRIFIWRGSIALARAHLIRGVGLGAESFVQTYPEYMIVQTPAPHAHSTYLEILIEVGLLGFLAFAWFFAVWIFDALRSLMAKGTERVSRWASLGTMAGILASAAGHLTHAIIEYTWYSPRVTSVFWLLIGLGSGIVLLDMRMKREREGSLG